MFMTRTELSRLLRVPGAVAGEPPPRPACAEAQADGVPCGDVHSDCECCGRARAGEAPEGGTERPH